MVFVGFFWVALWIGECGLRIGRVFYIGFRSCLISCLFFWIISGEVFLFCGGYGRYRFLGGGYRWVGVRFWVVGFGFWFGFGDIILLGEWFGFLGFGVFYLGFFFRVIGRDFLNVFRFWRLRLSFLFLNDGYCFRLFFFLFKYFINRIGVFLFCVYGFIRSASLSLRFGSDIVCWCYLF